MKNKKKICELLLKALQATRQLDDLCNLTYHRNSKEEYVIASFMNGATKCINVTMDSGLAMIRDITRSLS